MSIRKIIEIDEDKCTGCGQCIPSCAEGALEIIDGKAKIVKDMYCDGLGACLGHCPEGALTVIEREAPDFDEHAAMAHVAAQQQAGQARAAKAPPLMTPRQCPGSMMQSFAPAAAPFQAAAPTGSALSHWPVKLRLVPPQAPFLRGSHLLIAADCVPAALGSFHPGLLAGKVMVMVCPKFEDPMPNFNKLKEIFATAGVAEVTVADMEVPCCSVLPGMVRQAVAESGKNIPVHEVTVGIRGDLRRG